MSSSFSNAATDRQLDQQQIALLHSLCNGTLPPEIAEYVIP